MPPKKRKRKAVELPRAVHAKNKAYGRQYRKNRERVLGQSRRCALRFEGCEGWASETDHIVEAGRGGPSTVENLQPSCRSCNQKKKDRDWRAAKSSPAPAAPLRFPTEGLCPHRSFDGTAWCVGSVEPGHPSRWWFPDEKPDDDGPGAVIV
jgi:5-methylcytosine-specific restriction endonuclease McrA